MTTNPQTDRTIHAPWTAEQVTALNAFQQRGGMHSFTCGGDHTPGSPALVAYTDGWRCPQPYGEACDYRQDWAHAFMAEATAASAVSVAAPPADRAAVLREAADALEAWRPEFSERWAVAERQRYEDGVDAAADKLRRLAAETPQPTAQAPHPPETSWQIETQWHTGDWRSWSVRTEHDDALQEFERVKDGKHAWRLVRFHTTTAVEAEHAPAVVSQPGKEA